MPIDQQTFNSLKGLWNAAGGEPGKADVAAAIAFAESSGCQYALAGPVDIRPVKECTWHKTDGENSCGYWQINIAVHKQYTAPAIFEEYENANAAVAISDHGASFVHWSTFTNGAYLAYLKKFAGEAPSAPPPVQTTVNVHGGASEAPIAQRLTSDHGWNSLMRGMTRTAPTNIAYTRQMNKGLTALSRRHR